MPGRVLDDHECIPEELRERCGLPENACCRNCGESECTLDRDWDDDWDDVWDDVCGGWVLSPPYEGKIYEVIDNKVIASFGVEFDGDHVLG
jgi:hypothetical protein